MSKEPGFFLSINEIIELNALTVVTHRQVETADLEKLKICLDAGAKINCKKNNKSLVASALQEGNENVLSMLWEHDKDGAWVSISDAYRVAVVNERRSWFEKMLDSQYKGKVIHKLGTLIPEAAALKKWWAIDAAFKKFPKEFEKGLRIASDDQFILTEICKDPKSPEHLFDKMVEACKPYWPSVQFFSLSGERNANRDPVSPLSLLLKNGQYDRAEKLVSQGYPVNSSSMTRHYDNWFEVYSVVMLGANQKALAWLLEKGATPFVSKDDSFNDKEMSRELVEESWLRSKEMRSRGAIYNLPHWDLALNIAIKNNRPDLGKLLLGAGCSVERASFDRDDASKKKAAEFEREILKLNAVEKIGGLNSATPRAL